MNKKFQIRDDILRLARRRAAREGRALGDLMQDALAHYLAEDLAKSQARKAAYRLFCKKPMKIPPDQLRYLIEEDIWNS